MTPDDVIGLFEVEKKLRRRVKSLSLHISNACAMTHTNDWSVFSQKLSKTPHWDA